MTEIDFTMYLNERFDSMTTLMNAHFKNVDDRLEKIETQTTKTNGRVSDLEKFRANHEGQEQAESKIFSRKWVKIGVFVSIVSIITIVAVNHFNKKEKENYTQSIVKEVIEQLKVR